MNTLLETVERRLVAGEATLVSAGEAEAIAALPWSDNPDILALACLVRARRARPLFTCAIINAKSGRCPEDCAFCAQSAHHHTGAPEYPLVDTDTLVRHAVKMAENGVDRYGIVTSGTTISERDLESLCRSAEVLRREVDIALCASLGILSKEKAVCLKQAGFTSYHHNLETARSYFPMICTTHSYDEDVETLAVAREAGFRVCSCGIFGLGESWKQRVELLETVRECRVDSLPVNFLSPVPGTRLGKRPPLPPAEALRALALARLVNPEKDILVCGGRLSTLGEHNSWVMAAGASGLMTGDYLTTGGCGYETDNAMFRAIGFRR